jgi:hypothetical protein
MRQDRAPGVVVPEERVEPVLHNLLSAVGQRVGPGAQPPAQSLGRFDDDDPDSAFGERDRGADACHPGSDDDGLRAGRCFAGQPGVGHDQSSWAHPEGSGAAAERGHRGLAREWAKGSATEPMIRPPANADPGNPKNARWASTEDAYTHR